MRLRATSCAAVVLLVAASAAAKETPQAVLEDAKALAKKGETLKAAERFGDAVALAQAASDGPAEEAAADALDAFIDDAKRLVEQAKSSAGVTSDTPALAPLLVAVMKKLDPSRCGAYVSAPVLARNVLELATKTGDFAFVADAAKVAAIHAAKPTSGAAAKAVASYAEGLSAVAAGKFGDAAMPLWSAATSASDAGWQELGVYVGTELAATMMRRGVVAEGAFAAITAAVGGMDDKSDPLLVYEWKEMVKTRLAGAPPEVGKIVADLAARLTPSSAGETGGAGGRGAPGRAGGAAPVSPIGAALPKLGKGKPFVSVRRAASGFELRWLTKMAAKPLSAFDERGVTYVDEGGVTLGFHGRSACLLRVDLVGEKAGLGGRVAPGSARAYYLVADGETWSVTKEGIVVFSR